MKPLNVSMKKYGVLHIYILDDPWPGFGDQMVEAQKGKQGDLVTGFFDRPDERGWWNEIHRK